MSTDQPNQNLASKHADGLAVSRSLTANQEAHQHEHAGPGTIRNHNHNDLSWDQEALDRVVAELMVDDPGFYYPEGILADPDAHPLHRLFAVINIGVRDLGTRWSKCVNCGQSYQLTALWDNDTACSRRCAEEYLAYLNNPSSL